MLQLENVSIYLGAQVLIAPFSLEIAAGEIVTVMGPSGCGKSSLLSGIAGTLEPPLRIVGSITLNSKSLNAIRPEQRRVGRLFQDDVLFPHLSIGENLRFGIARGPRDQRLLKMREGLRDIELAGFENRSPHTLSGGQRQRVALMRSLLARPDCMLLDEPFSKFDQTLREAMRQKTFELLRQHQTPTLLVTHDLADAPKGGRVLQFTTQGKIVYV
jgi:putative thiamine transport system ATP-binding protein